MGFVAAAVLVVASGCALGLCGEVLPDALPVFKLGAEDFGERLGNPTCDFSDGCSRFCVAACKAAENGLSEEEPADEFAGSPAVGTGLITIFGEQAITVLASAEEFASGSPKVPD